ncbi:unknown protein [Seminavis robusta]|uniref:Uncharacterized protein n=1 Tax=Seminavis robusta TaxID=568900 RepID=A0A9N8HQ94_9STRA|nr:unknown protein [Seminavis robusta]|eukprot:Sro1171_g248920.1 n/a (260) ;mRNA; f:30227-31006
MKLFVSIYLCALVSGFATIRLQSGKHQLYNSQHNSVLFASLIHVNDPELGRFEHAPEGLLVMQEAHNAELFEPKIDTTEPDAGTSLQDFDFVNTIPLTPHYIGASSYVMEYGDTINILEPQHSTPETAVKNIGHKRVKQLCRAGTASLQQRLHSAFGLGSLLFGSLHYLDITTHGYAVPVSQTEILGIGALHVMVAFMGLPRLDWKNEKEASRNALIWPVPLQNIWLLAASLTELAQGRDALISMESPAFVAFTAFNLY